MNKKILGINGLGRVGKLTLRAQLAKDGLDGFDEIVVNLGREAGDSLQSIIEYLLRDSTYGSLSSYLFGAASRKEVEVRILSAEEGLVLLNGKRVRFLRSERNPKHIDWMGAELVVDTTGQFKDPTRSPDDERGSIYGHLAGNPSVKKVIVSAPFSVEGDKPMPEDAITLIPGINDGAYIPGQHRIISNASCTTTCLAHMLRPMLQHFEPDSLMALTMETIHAVTAKQPMLDRVPGVGETDPCKHRSGFNNIHLTTTGATKALALVMPEIAGVPFLSQSIRIPTMTGSLVVLTADFNSFSLGDDPVVTVNNVMRRAAEFDQTGYLKFSDAPNVSSDIVGAPFAAALIEGVQTQVSSCGPEGRFKKVRLYGWYDNEKGSYVNMLGEQLSRIADSIG